ncbi:MAG TPA: hypothetical protein VNW99_05585 [Cytophagaceae bacterium]|nr:hypothetical protein [Cytophagaceae bacterium]
MKLLTADPLFVLLFLSVSFFSSAQSIDFEKVNYTYTQPPQNPFPKGTKTYSIKVNPGSVNFTGKGYNYNIGYNVEQAITQDLLVNGYQRVFPGSTVAPDIIMEYFFSGVALARQTMNSNTQTVNAQPVITYHLDLVYYFPVTLNLEDKTGTVIQNITLISPNAEHTLRYPEQPFNDFKDKYQLQSSFSSSSFNNYVNNYLRDMALNSASSYIRNHFAYSDVTETLHLPYIESKKYNFPLLDSCHAKLMKAIALINAKGSQDQIKSLLNGALGNSLTLAADYDPKNNNGKGVTEKISGICDYNSAIAFMLLDQYDLALSSLQTSHEKMGHGHLAALKSLIEDKKKRFIANQ